MYRLAPEVTIDTAILDFDGTIADSGKIFTETAQAVLKRPDPFTDDEIDHLRRLSVKEQMHVLGVKPWQLPFLARAGRRMIVERMGEVGVFPGIREAIGELSESHELYVLSTNSIDAIEGVITRYDLPISMDNVHHGSGILKKARRLSSLLLNEGLLPAQCAYVGDEIRDIHAAQKVGVSSVAVEWGYALPEVLAACRPDAMVTSPAELPQTIRSLS